MTLSARMSDLDEPRSGHSPRAYNADPEGLDIGYIEIPPTEALSQWYGDWTVVTDRWLLDKVTRACLDGLPNETGGVLIGAHDMQRHVLYLVDALPSPPDSEEWPGLYVHGSRGLTKRIGEVERTTDGRQLGYAGEWHSHPRGCGPSPSRDDRKVFAWLQEHMSLEALPPAMIVGESDSALFVGSIP
jgi:proteasome lid subunit RPN8/RPN11